MAVLVVLVVRTQKVLQLIESVVALNRTLRCPESDYDLIKYDSERAVRLLHEATALTSDPRVLAAKVRPAKRPAPHPPSAPPPTPDSLRHHLLHGTSCLYCSHFLSTCGAATAWQPHDMLHYAPDWEFYGRDMLRLSTG